MCAVQLCMLDMHDPACLGRCAGDIVFAMDDKLGSWWIFLPMPKDMKETKATASLYRYHQTVQGNSYPGYGNFMSLVPPLLSTGNNFGCTAFCITLYKLVKTGKVCVVIMCLPATPTHLSTKHPPYHSCRVRSYLFLRGVLPVLHKVLPNQTTIIRNTDSGSDNDGKMTHCVHYVLVREGACNELEWARLIPGHSHNAQDLTFANAKAIFYPNNGRGPGCDSPFEFHAKLLDGLKHMAGGCEILWQLANFNFTALWESCIHRDFGGIRYADAHCVATRSHACSHDMQTSNKACDRVCLVCGRQRTRRPSNEDTEDAIAYPRCWRYTYAPELDNLLVRCTFKYKLTDQVCLLPL